jgi:hypothetical protein
MTSLILATALSLSSPTDTVLVLSTTVTNSTLEELELVNSFILQSETQVRTDDKVYFYNQNRDTVLVRFINESGSDETYKLYQL